MGKSLAAIAGELAVTRQRGRTLPKVADSVRECNRLWLLKNSSWSVIRVKSGDQKCLEIRKDRL